MICVLNIFKKNNNSFQHTILQNKTEKLSLIWLDGSLLAAIYILKITYMMQLARNTKNIDLGHKTAQFESSTRKFNLCMQESSIPYYVDWH
jgi:hypothetical protein